MTEQLPFPLEGSTLLLGPSNVGKTRLTALALDRWVDRDGPDDVVVFEFGPEVVQDGTVLGGRLDRFTAVPDRCWHGVIDAHAPRAQSATAEEATELAASNARRSAELFDAAPPDPVAVFVNDATIPFQHRIGDPEGLTTYCDAARCTVLNAFDSEELGTDDPVSRREAAALSTFKAWADRIVQLE